MRVCRHSRDEWRLCAACLTWFCHCLNCTVVVTCCDCGANVKAEKNFWRTLLRRPESR